MTQMKQQPLEKLGLEFKDLLMTEMVQDQHKEISRYASLIRKKIVLIKSRNCLFDLNQIIKSL